VLLHSHGHGRINRCARGGTGLGSRAQRTCLAGSWWGITRGRGGVGLVLSADRLVLSCFTNVRSSESSTVSYDVCVRPPGRPSTTFLLGGNMMVGRAARPGLREKATSAHCAPPIRNQGVVLRNLLPLNLRDRVSSRR
jgi:hypothetical protein